MFDVLTYQKGSTVLRMFQMFIGEEAFRNGVESYLNKFKLLIIRLLTLNNNINQVKDIEFLP